ncbi:MAG: hypothetical protein ACXAEX_17415 [Promethearchaeota archaeon]|jgi:proteasome lid subunit RPN8/RPN11/predicted nuclease with TOPRIM domain
MGKIVDNSVVTIKPLAYYKMLLHVLRFGSKYLEHSNLKEVMGILIGHLEGEGEIKDVIIEDVVPVSHGGTIEVKFSVEQLGAFGEIDLKIFEQYGDLGWFSVGWYHSHPGLGFFFSETDKYNQIFWQKSPSGLGIVFDHTALDKPEDLGFRVFRLDETDLDDPSVAMKSDYHEVKATVEPPKSVDFYLKIMGLINKVHTGIPQILELNETIDLFGDVFIPEEEHIASTIPEIGSEELLSSLKNGMENFLELSIKPLLNLLNSWSKTTIHRISINNSQMRNNLKELKEKLSNEIINLQKSFNYDLQNDLRDLDFYVDDKLEDLDKEKEEIETLISKASEEYENQINKLFQEKIQTIVSPFLNGLASISSNISDLNQKLSNQINNQESGFSTLTSLTEGYSAIDSLIQSNLSTKQGESLTDFSKRINRMKGNLNNLNKDSKSYLSDLKAAIILLESSKNPIENKLKTLQTENKEYQKNIQDLKSENQQLLTKIKKLEKGGE